MSIMQSTVAAKISLMSSVVVTGWRSAGSVVIVGAGRGLRVNAPCRPGYRQPGPTP
jgi:hypothetical protein